MLLCVFFLFIVFSKTNGKVDWLQEWLQDSLPMVHGDCLVWMSNLPSYRNKFWWFHCFCIFKVFIFSSLTKIKNENVNIPILVQICMVFFLVSKISPAPVELHHMWPGVGFWWWLWMQRGCCRGVCDWARRERAGGCAQGRQVSVGDHSRKGQQWCCLVAVRRQHILLFELRVENEYEYIDSVYSRLRLRDMRLHRGGADSCID